MANFSLTAMLGLNSQAFQNGLSNANGAVGTFRTALTRLGPVIGAVGLTQMARNAVELGSKLSDLSTQLNIDSEALQTLRFESQEAGVKMQSLERALRNVQLRTEEAINGNRSYSDAFERLGIDIEEFRELPVEEKLQAIATAQENATDKTGAFNDVARILGERAGPELQEVLQSLARNGFDELKQKADDAGQLMSNDTSVAMDDVADRMEALKTRTTNLVAEGLNRAIGAFDMIVEALGLIKDNAVAGGTALFEFGRTLGDIINAAVTPAITAFDGLKDATIAVGQAITGNFDGARESIDSAKDKVTEALDQIRELPSTIASEFDEMNENMEASNAEFEEKAEERNQKIEDGFTRMMTGVVATSEEAGEDMSNNLTPDLSNSVSNANDVAGAIGGIKTSADNAGQSIEEMNQQRLDHLRNQASSTQSAIDGLKGEIEAAKHEILSLNQSNLDEFAARFGVSAENLGELVEHQLSTNGIEAADATEAQFNSALQTVFGNLRQEVRDTEGSLGEAVSRIMPTPEELSEIGSLLRTVSAQSEALAEAPRTVETVTQELHEMMNELGRLEGTLNNIDTEIQDIELSTNLVSSALETKATEIANIEIPDALGNVGDGSDGGGGIDLSEIGSKLDTSNGHLEDISNTLDGKFVNQ